MEARKFGTHLWYNKEYL